MKQNLIPYMWQMVLANISIQGWIVDPNVQSFFYCSSEVLVLLPTMLKFSTLMLWPVVLKWSNMGEGAFWCSLNLSPKSSWGLSYIFLITLHPATFVTVDDPTLLQHRIFVLWGHQEVFDGYTSFKVDLNPIVAAFLLYTLTQPLVVWHSYVWFGGVVLLSGICFVSLLLGLVVHLHLYSIQSPYGVITVHQCFW